MSRLCRPPVRDMWTVVAVATGVMLLAACTPKSDRSTLPAQVPTALPLSPQAGATTDAGVATAVIVPGDPTAEAACQPSSHAVKAYLNRQDHYCVEYPVSFGLLTVDASPVYRAVTIISPPQGTNAPESAGPTMSIQASPASAGTSLDQAAQQQMAQFGTQRNDQVTAKSAILAGQPALVLDGVPGQWTTRQAYVLHNGQLYTFIVTPWQDSTLGDRQADSEALWQTVTASFQFTDADTDDSSTTATGSTDG